MSRRDLNALCATLADLLGLTAEGWRISVKVDKKLADLAQIDWSPARREAFITIQGTKAVTNSFPPDQRLNAHALVLAHELLHLRLEGHLDPAGDVVPPYEWALDKLAEIVVARHLR